MKVNWAFKSDIRSSMLSVLFCPSQPPGRILIDLKYEFALKFRMYINNLFLVFKSNLKLNYVSIQEYLLVIHLDEPRKWKLIHWINVGKLASTKEQYGWMHSHRLITVAHVVYLLFSSCSNLLLCSNFFRQNFRAKIALKFEGCQICFYEV